MLSLLFLLLHNPAPSVTRRAVQQRSFIHHRRPGSLRRQHPCIALLCQVCRRIAVAYLAVEKVQQFAVEAFKHGGGGGPAAVPAGRVRVLDENKNDSNWSEEALGFVAGRVLQKSATSLSHQLGRFCFGAYLEATVR